LCEQKTKNKISVGKDLETRPGDVKVYITNDSKVTRLTKWSPRISVSETVEDVLNWITKNKSVLNPIFN